MKALMAVANIWNAPFQVGSHQIARGLLRRGWQVAFVSDPISPLHVLGGVNDALHGRWMTYRRGGVWSQDGQLWEYVPGALLTPHQFPGMNSEWLYRNWQRLSIPDVVDMAKTNGFGDVDLFYTDVVSQEFWLDALRWRKSVFRITDYYRGFKKFTLSATRSEQRIARRTDLTIFSAASLKEHVASLQPRKSAFLPNGVNYDHFQKKTDLPREYEKIPPPRVVYAGAMNDWFDFDTINVLSSSMPDVSFVLIGPERLALQKLNRAANLYVLGPRPYEALPAYLQHAQVGIIPFDVLNHGTLVHHVHPLKLYEYAACGLPVLASNWDEISRMDSPAILCDNATDFVNGLRKVLDLPPDASLQRSYARRADWSMRLDALLAALELR